MKTRQRKQRRKKWRREESIVDRWESRSETGNWKMESQSVLSKAKFWLMSWCQLPRDWMQWRKEWAIFSSEPQIEKAILYVSSIHHCFGLPAGLGLKLNLRNRWSLSDTRQRNGCVSFDIAILLNDLSCCLIMMMLSCSSSAAARTCMLEIRLKMNAGSSWFSVNTCNEKDLIAYAHTGSTKCFRVHIAICLISMSWIKQFAVNWKICMRPNALKIWEKRCMA